MILLSWGMPRSGSSFCFQISREILEFYGHNNYIIQEKFLPIEFRDNYLDITSDSLDKLLNYVPDEVILIVKTHSYLYDEIKSYIEQGKVKATATFRNPMGIILSLVDVGEADRKNKKERGFNKIFTVDDAINYFKTEIFPAALRWIDCDNIFKISYKKLTTDTNEVFYNFIDYLDLQKNINNIKQVDKIINKYQGKDNIWEFNIGKYKRYLDFFTTEEINKFENDFKDLIEKIERLKNQNM
jgi:hypothetical protein